MNTNPYSPPTALPTEDETPVSSVTRIPKRLLRRTRQSLAMLGLGMILLPLLVLFFVSDSTVNLLGCFLGFFVLVVAVEIHPRSFRRFPRTILLCIFLVVHFLVLVGETDWTEASNWLPHRGSPVFSIPLVTALLACWAGLNVWRCYRHHQLFDDSASL